jgi:hypothetical protein
MNFLHFIKSSTRLFRLFYIQNYEPNKVKITYNFEWMEAKYAEGLARCVVKLEPFVP